MATFSAITKKKLPFTDKLNPVWSGDTPQAVEARRRADLFRALNQFVMENGGQITSPPSARTVRIEIGPDSTLPEKLIAHGYNPIRRGTQTKTSYHGIAQVEVIEIDIDGR